MARLADSRATNAELHYLFVAITKEDKAKQEAKIHAALVAAWAAGASAAQHGDPYAKYLLATGDYYDCIGKNVRRNVSFTLYGSDDQKIGTGVITEHLFPIDYNDPIITKPGVNTRLGNPTAPSTTKSR